MRPLSSILCAPDKFKGTLSAAEVAAAMARGIRAAQPEAEVRMCPVADGGEGSTQLLVESLGGQMVQHEALGPRGETMHAAFGIVQARGLGVIEFAAASGLALLKQQQRDPTRTTSFGTGQLMRAAIGAGAREIVLCLGGSATVDGGCGMAQAMGVRFLDGTGRELSQPMCGGAIGSIAHVEIPRGLPPILVACDVDNPLLGTTGAARVYGPQKGATPAQVEELEQALAHLASLLSEHDSTTHGSGAAGGAGFGAMAMLGGVLLPGADFVLDILGFDETCRGCELVLTGEGKLDDQSRRGKACMAVAKRAAALGVPTVAIAGQFGDGYEDCIGSLEDGALAAAYSLSETIGEARAMVETTSAIEQIASSIVRTWDEIQRDR